MHRGPGQLKRNLSWVKTAWGRSASIYEDFWRLNLMQQSNQSDSISFNKLNSDSFTAMNPELSLIDEMKIDWLAALVGCRQFILIQTDSLIPFLLSFHWFNLTSFHFGNEIQSDWSIPRKEKQKLRINWIRN